MKTILRTSSLMAFVALTAGVLQAVELDVKSRPLSHKSYDSIDLESVSPEVKPDIPEWLKWVRQNNPQMATGVRVEKLVAIDIHLAEEEDPTVIDEFIAKARKEAALWGANRVTLEDQIFDEKGKGVASAQFVAYHIEYKDKLIPPAYQSALAYTPLPITFAEAKIQEWNASHIGTIRTTFAANHRGEVSEESVVNFLSSVKQGTPVRVVLRDGSDMKGLYNGLDEDNLVWIRPTGLRGMIADRAFKAKHIESVGILN